MFRSEFLARCTLAAGRPVTRDMLEHCQRRGYVTRPPKHGGRGWYDESHLAQMLDHLEKRGRYVSAEARRLIEQAHKVGMTPRPAPELKGKAGE